MSHTLDLLSTVEHGTVAGYWSGCHGSTISCGAVVSCADVYIRYQGDWGFRKRVDAGESPVDIIAAELAELDAVRARDKAANRKVKADGARIAEERTQKQRRMSAKPRPQVPTLAEKISEDVRRLIGEGKTGKETAAILGVSVFAVSRARRAMDLKTSRQSIDRAEVARLNGEGWSDTRIAQHLGVTNGAISNIRRNELHLPKIPTSHAPKVTESARAARARRITELHAEGMHDGEIADALDLNRSTVYQARIRLGLPLNRQSRRKPATAPERPEPDTAHDEPQEPREAVIRAHGTPQGYVDGCRGRGCPNTPTCKDAMLEQHRAQRRAGGAL